MISIELLKENYFPGIRSLHTHQEILLEHLAGGHNSLGVIRTGGGKSLIFQLQAMREPGLTLVISPLLALMKEQVDELNDRGIPAAALNGSMSFQQQRHFLRQLPGSNIKLLYLSPERLYKTIFQKGLLNCGRKVSMVVIDEAHCISQWGASFRPDYANIPDFINLLREEGHPAKVLALTATLAKQPREDVLREFGILQKHSFVPDSILRNNLDLSFRKVVEEKEKQPLLLDWIAARPDKKILVYTYSRKKCEDLARDLADLGYAADYFHAGRDQHKKDEAFRRYKEGDTNILIATSAFGMGINIPDIEGVVHYQIPNSVEEYYQMVGRGWRKSSPEKTCDCLCLWSDINFEIRIRDLNMLREQYATIKDLYELMRGKTMGDIVLESGTIRYYPLDNLLDKKMHSRRVLFYHAVKAGCIELLGTLPASLSEISLQSNEPFWEKVNEIAEEGIDSVDYIMEELDQPTALIDYIYDKELKGEIDKFPAYGHVLLYRLLEPELSDEKAATIQEAIYANIDQQIAQIEELKRLVESEDPDALLEEILGKKGD